MCCALSTTVSTEQNYAGWIKRFIPFYGKSQAKQLAPGGESIELIEACEIDYELLDKI